MGNTLINVRKPALSVFSVISKVCLLFGEGGHGKGEVEVMMVLGVATVLCW